MCVAALATLTCDVADAEVRGAVHVADQPVARVDAVEVPSNHTSVFAGQ